MSEKRKILRIAIFVFMVLSISLTTSQTLAYWAQPPSIVSTTTTGTVTTGTWEQAFPYDPNATYLDGDLVTNNGVTYSAKGDFPTKEPGVDNGWNSDWDRL
jgi:heme-binding NEAT domain protein